MGIIARIFGRKEKKPTSAPPPAPARAHHVGGPSVRSAPPPRSEVSRYSDRRNADASGGVDVTPSFHNFSPSYGGSSPSCAPATHGGHSHSHGDSSSSSCGGGDGGGGGGGD